MKGIPKGVLDTLATVLVCVAAIFVLWTQIEARWVTPRQNQQVQDIENIAFEPSTLRHVKGGGDVALIEFTDYECPFCARHAQEVEPSLNELVASNRVRYEVFHFPLERIHQNARQAAAAAECASRQGRFWDMHHQLFQEQKSLSRDNLIGFAESLKLDVPSFVRCVGSEADLQVTNDLTEGRRLGVASTPTFSLAVTRLMAESSWSSELRACCRHKRYSTLLAL